MSKPSHRTFIAYLEDKPGVLNRVTSLFRRRNYNILSLTVGQSDRPGISRMTLVMDIDEDGSRRLVANLYKLVNVLWVEDTTHVQTVIRDMALIKVRADAATRTQIMQLCEVFHARVIDVGPEALMVEITGTEDQLDGLEVVLRPYGIMEMVQTGPVAMLRSTEPVALERVSVAPPAKTEEEETAA